MLLGNNLVFYKYIVIENEYDSLVINEYDSCGGRIIVDNLK